MGNRRLPIFIATPFIGQGDIHNIEWIEGRIALFEAVTKNSLMSMVGDDVHWLIFLGTKPLPSVEEYATNLFGGNEYIHPVKLRFSSENVTMLASKISPMERYITTLIADDDAWTKKYPEIIRKNANQLLDDGHEFAGMSYANGLEWVMADQVDIHCFQNSNFKVLRKQNLVEFRSPWLGCGFFILQTKNRPFEYNTVGHPQIPAHLEKSGFSVHVSEEPRRVWLYNRHQLSASSLVKSGEKPLEFTLEDLEEEFGIDAELVRNWPNTKYGSYYSEKAQGVGMLEMYSFPDITDFVHMPFKSFFFDDGFLVIEPSSQFNIEPPLRIRIYNITTKSYETILTINSELRQPIKFHESMFESSNEYKFDLQKLQSERWTRVMPFVLIRQNDSSIDTDRNSQEELFLSLPEVHPNNAVKLLISNENRLIQINSKYSHLSRMRINKSVIQSGQVSFYSDDNDKWNLENRWKIV